MLRALGYDDQVYLKDAVKLAASVKDGFLTWGEFLDFFFLRDATGVDRMDGDDWWNNLDPNGKVMQTKEEAAEEAEELNRTNEADQQDKTGPSK